MDTWTGPREPIAKKILFPVVSGHLPSIAIAFDRISRDIAPWTTVHHHIRTLTYLPYLYHSINSLRFSSSRNISFLFFFPFFFFFFFEFIPRFSRESRLRDFRNSREAREGTSTRLPIQSYDNYFAQPLRTRCTNERITRGLVSFFSFA